VKCLASSTPKIWPGPQDVEMGQVTLTSPTWGIVSHHKANIHAANSCIKFEVSSFSRSRDSSGGIKFKNVSHDPDCGDAFPMEWLQAFTYLLRRAERRRPIRFNWFEVSSHDWLGSFLALAQAGCQASLRWSASLCVESGKKAEAGCRSPVLLVGFVLGEWRKQKRVVEARYCSLWTTWVVIEDGCWCGEQLSALMVWVYFIVSWWFWVILAYLSCICVYWVVVNNFRIVFILYVTCDYWCVIVCLWTLNICDAETFNYC